MAIKGIPAAVDPFTGPNNNIDLIQGVGPTTYQGLLAGPDDELRSKVWSELVTRDAREKNVFAKFIGGEGGGKPISEKRQLSAGGSDKVIFTTVAPIRGQGVRGEEFLKNSTDKLNFGTFGVEVDLVRHAVSWTQVLKLMRFTGKTLDQLSAEVMTEWMSRTEQDHLQFCLRQTCETIGSDNKISAYGNPGASGAAISVGALTYSDGLSTDIIQEAKQALIARGGEPINTGGDENQEIPGYLFFAPDGCLRPLRSDPDYLEAITQADSRGENNKLYSGSYARWDNNLIANHNIIIDTANGRQGSPLAPTFTNADALADAETLIGEDPATNPGDWMANFMGSPVRIPGGGGARTLLEANTYHILGVDSATGEFRCYSYVAADFGAAMGGIYGATFVDLSGGTLSGGTQKASNAFAANSTFYQCNEIGTPIGYALAMGKDALYYAKGGVFGEQIFHYDDFANSGNEAHLSAVGVQSVYGMAVREDTKDRVPAIQLVECVRQIPGLVLDNTG
jgi:N4-gp56 family major capsid protein